MEKAIHIISDFMRGVGTLFLVSPIALNWFIHGDYDRYIWIIKGPEPFNRFGGGPFQLYLYISLIACGAILVALSGKLGKGR